MGFGLGIDSIDRYFVFLHFFILFQALSVVTVGGGVGWEKLVGLVFGGM